MRAQRIGRYEIVRQLGQGGMGTVYEVHDSQAGRNLALKFLPRARAVGKSATRFSREAQALARVRHPNVVMVHDVGEDPAGLYYTMDLVHGQEVGELALSGVIPERDAAELALGVSEAVSAIHAVGLLHRDVKPDNVVLRADRGTPILLDFGLALAADSDRLTKTGQIVGTPYAMSPEQASGTRELTPATDVYGVGVILYMLLAKRPPFEADDMLSLLAAVCREEPEWPAASPGLVSIMRCAMAKAPEERYSTAEELSQDLQRFLAGERVAAGPPRGRRGGVLVVLGLLACAGVALALATRGNASTLEPAATSTSTSTSNGGGGGDASPRRSRRVRVRDPLRELSRARAAPGAEGRRLIARWLADFPDRPEGDSLRKAYLLRGWKEPVKTWKISTAAANLASRGEQVVIQTSGVAWAWTPERPLAVILKGDLSKVAAGPKGWLVFGAQHSTLAQGKRRTSTALLLGPGGERGRLATSSGSRVRALACAGRTLWAGHSDGSLSGFRWSGPYARSKPERIAILREFRSPVASIAYDPERQLLFATSGEMVFEDRNAPDRRLVGWSLKTTPPTKLCDLKLPGSGGKIRLHPTKELLALSVLWVQEIRIYDFGGKLLRSLEGVTAETGTTQILAGSSGVTAHSMQIRGLEFLPEGLLLSSAGKLREGELRAWDVESGEEVAVKTKLEGVVFDIHVTPGGQVFMSHYLRAKHPGVLEQWDLVPGALEPGAPSPGSEPGASEPGASEPGR